MGDEANTEWPSPPTRQLSLRLIVKVTAYLVATIYVAWRSWDHLGFTVIIFLLLSPFIFFAEIVDRLLGAKKR